jgi:hypothetical protein
MAFTFRAGNTLSTNAGTFTSYTRSITGSGVIDIQETIPTGAGTVITVAIDVSAVQAFGLSSTKTGTLTINDDGTPDATISLTANVPIVWVAGASSQYPSSNPLGSVDVTSMKFTQASGADAMLEFACLLDVTP